MGWLENRANAARGLPVEQPGGSNNNGTSTSPDWLTNRAGAARSLGVNSVPANPVEPVSVAPDKPKTNPLVAVQNFISNLIGGKKPEETPAINIPNNIDPNKIPQELKSIDTVKESGASANKTPNFIGQLVDAYKNYTQGQLKKEQENKIIKLTEEAQGKKDPKKIASLSKDLEEITLAMQNPSLGKKYIVASKQKFMTDLGSVGAGASTLISSIADFYNRVYEQDAETMNKMASFKENPKVLNWLYKQESEKSAAKSDVSKSVSKDVRKWAEEVSPANPDFMDGLKNGVGSMGAFLVASVASGGGATEMAVLEAMSESGTVYRENRDKSKSIAESSELADKDFLANLVINYFTNKAGIFTDQQVGIRKTIMAGSSEGTQEALQQIASNLSTGKDMMDGVWESLGIGGILGTAVSPFELGDTKPTEITGENVQEKPVQQPKQEPSNQKQELPVNKTPALEITKEPITVYRGTTVAGEELNTTKPNGLTIGESTSTDIKVAERFANKKGGEVQTYEIQPNATIINHSYLEALTKDIKGIKAKLDFTTKFLKENGIDIVRFDIPAGSLGESELRIVNPNVIKKVQIKADTNINPSVENPSQSTTEPVISGKKDFYILRYDEKGSNPSFQKVDGKSVEIKKGWETFVDKREGEWFVTEASSGKSVASGKTRKEAIEKATNALNTVKNPESFIQKSIDRYGAAPGYGESKQVSKPKKITVKEKTKESVVESRPKTEVNKELTARTPEQLKEMLDSLNKYGQTHAILRKIGGITNKRAAGQFVPPSPKRVDVAKEGEVRLKGKYVVGDREYISVMAHELGHATELHVTGEINKKTLNVFGENLSKDTRATIQQELENVTEKLEGAMTVASNPQYYHMKTELLARFFEMYITNPELLKDTAPTAYDHLEMQSVKVPMLREFLEITDEHMQKVDKAKTSFLSDLRQTYQGALGKRVGNIVFDEEMVHRAMIERAKTVLPKFINEKFANVKDDPALLFRVAESVKVTKDGIPEFGTRDFAELENKYYNTPKSDDLRIAGFQYTETVNRDGVAMDIYAKQRYTAEEGKALFDQLSPEGQQLIKDFTAQKSEAKDYFNREMIKEVNGIESNIEGWVHHYFEGDDKKPMIGKGLGFKNKKAGAAKHRTGEAGYVEDLQKATTKAVVELQMAKDFNNFVQKQFARVSKPIREGEKPDAGWVEVVGNVKSGVGLEVDKRQRVIQDGKSFVAKQTRYQIPEAVYERYNKYRGIVKEASGVAKMLQRLNSYWAINILTDAGTAGTNFIGGGIQYSAKVLTDFYGELLRGDVKMTQTRKNVSAMLKTLLPKGWAAAPDYVYGADQSNWYGMFQNKQVHPVDKAIDKFADTNLKLFGAYERYWKKVIMTSENVSDLDSLNKMTKEGLQLPTDQQKALIAKINKEVDLYAYDYDNVPLWLMNMKKNPVLTGLKPFATYPYKYAKQITNMAGAAFDQSLPWQDRAAKVLALSTIMALYAAYSDDRKKKQQTPEGTTPEIEIRAKTGGNLFTGLVDREGKEMFVRVSKYPFIGLTEAAIQTMKGNSESALNIFKEMVGSVGFVGDTALNLVGYRTEYEKYDSFGVVMGNNLAGLVPYTRILDEVSRGLDPFQRKQTNFGQTLTKLIPTTSADLQEKLHGDKRTVTIPIEGNVKRTPGTPYTRTTIDKTLQNYWQDILLSSLTGIYIKRVKPEDVEAQIIRDEKNKVKREKEAAKKKK